MASISKTTGETPYSGEWQDVANLVKVLNIGEGRLATITENLVEFFQEQTDREIDAYLEQYYYTPLRAFNSYQPAKSATVKIFPGEVLSLARYWTAGILLLTQFQNLDQNINEAATNYVTESKQKLYSLIRYNKRIAGQRWKHNLRTAPPTMMPGVNPESNW
jgi:hypothetical protein